jgi:hypothetical protein
MNLPLALPPVPPPPHASMIQNLSVVAMVSGIVLVLVALPPVRGAVRDLFDRITEFFYGPPRVTTEDPQSLVASSSEDKPTSTTRREIDDFDLDMFD